MGPAIFKFKKGDTQYSLRVFPIGGYCSMEGEDEQSESEDSFSKKSVYKRMIVVAAGAIMNIILAFAFMIIILVQQPQFASTKISKFSEDAVTCNYGLQVGDTIKSIDGYKISTFTDIGFILSVNSDFASNIIVNRNGEEVSLSEVKFKTYLNEDTGKEVIVRDFYVFPIEKKLLTLLTQSFKEMGSNIKMTYTSLVYMVTGKFSLNEVSGPIGVVKVVTDAASEGLKVNFLSALNNIIMIMMLLSVSLGIFNLLPLPALDGGRLTFLIIEAIKGKPINPKYEGMIHTIGFVAFILLMVVIAINDILKLCCGRGLIS